MGGTRLTERLRFIFSLLRCFTVDLQAVNKTYGHFKGLFRTQFEGLFKGSSLCISFMFYGSIKALTEVIRI